MLSGDVIPNKVTWLIITFTTYIYTASQIASEINSAIWGILAVGISLTFVTVFAIKFGVSKVNVVDMAVVAFSLVGLILWWQLSDPLASVVASALTGAISVVPTIRKLKLHPGTESTFTWFTAAIAQVPFFLAVDLKLEFVLVPVTWLFLNSAVAAANVIGVRSNQTTAA